MAYNILVECKESCILESVKRVDMGGPVIAPLNLCPSPCNIDFYYPTQTPCDGLKLYAGGHLTPFSVDKVGDKLVINPTWQNICK
jgi:hypothetical protein